MEEIKYKLENNISSKLLIFARNLLCDLLDEELGMKIYNELTIQLNQELNNDLNFELNYI